MFTSSDIVKAGIDELNQGALIAARRGAGDNFGNRRRRAAHRKKPLSEWSDA